MERLVEIPVTRTIRIWTHTVPSDSFVPSTLTRPSHRALSLPQPILFRVAQLHKFDGSTTFCDKGDPNAAGECLGLNEDFLAFDGLL